MTQIQTYCTIQRPDGSETSLSVLQVTQRRNGEVDLYLRENVCLTLAEGEEVILHDFRGDVWRSYRASTKG